MARRRRTAPVPLAEVNRGIRATALRLAEGDTSRIEVRSATSVVVDITGLPWRFDRLLSGGFAEQRDAV